MKMKNNNTTIKKYISKSMISVFTCSVLATGVFANPTGGTVASGTATIAGTTAMTVTQTTQNAIINWTGFNVANGESVAFTGGNATLNRISDINPSTIAGSVTGDHALFFVNPNGMVVTGSMSAPTIVLSTSDITDANFNAGNYKFTRGSATGTINNSGTIGDVGSAGNIGVAALFATTVTNTGVISAHNVAIVAADDVTLGATTSAVANGNYDATQNGYTGVTVNTASTAVTSIINNNSDQYHGIFALDNSLTLTSSGKIDIYSTNGTIDNSHNGWILSYSANGSSGDVVVHASGNILNNNGINSTNSMINSEGDGSGGIAGTITVISDNGYIDNSNNGLIMSKSLGGSSGDVTVQANGAILNTYGQISSEADNGAIGSAGAVHVTSTNGLINNNLGQIYSESANSSSAAVSVHAYGDVINTSIANNAGNGGIIYSEGDGNGALSGAVTVTSDNGKIDNSSWGAITSGSSTGTVTLTAHTLIDLRNGGAVASGGSWSVGAGDVTLSAPSLLYTPYATSSGNNAESVVVSQAGSTNNTMLPKNINITATTVNGVATSTLLASDFETTTTHFVNGDPTNLPYVWYGNVKVNGNNISSLSGTQPITTAVAQQQQANAINTVSAISSQLASTTNTFSSNPVVNNGHMQTAEFGSGLAQSSFAQNGSTTQSSFANSISDGNANHSNNSHESVTGATPMQGQVKFTVGADIVGTGNATASSTAVPGMFILSSEN